MRATLGDNENKEVRKNASVCFLGVDGIIGETRPDCSSRKSMTEKKGK